MNTRELPDDHRLPGSEYTLGELRETIRRMRALNDAFYWNNFHAGMGGRCHAFVEFAGLQAKFIDLCQAMLDQGIDFSMANQHSGTAPALDAHHAEYLGEKFACIYGHAFTPALRRAFEDAAFGRR